MSVSGWREALSERIALYSPVGLRLVDDFTGRAPLGSVRASLDLEVAAGLWAPTDIPSVRTPSSVLTWPGLGREYDPLSAPVRRYRARVDADSYRPAYLESDDGVEFDAPPWDDANPPVPVTSGPQELHLYPSTSYSFPTWIRVLRGGVKDAAGDPVANVLVHLGLAERVLSDERGTFALPLRWATSGMTVDASDARTNRTGSHALSLPNDLLNNVTITIT